VDVKALELPTVGSEMDFAVREHPIHIRQQTTNLAEAIKVVSARVHGRILTEPGTETSVRRM
jgi:hypothetical protein